MYFTPFMVFSFIFVRPLLLVYCINILIQAFLPFAFKNFFSNIIQTFYFVSECAANKLEIVLTNFYQRDANNLDF